MKYTIKLILTAGLVLIIRFCFSQPASSFTPLWRIKSATHLNDTQSFLCSGTFEFTENKIFFRQKGGEATYDFTIRKRLSLKSNDSTEFEVVFRGAEGVITINTENGSTLIAIHLSKGNQQILPYRFLVEQQN